jgi:predicted dehydrogenase
MRTGDGRGAEPYKVQPYFREMPRLLIYETLVHFLDTFRYLAGEIRDLTCVTRRVNPVIAGEDCVSIQLGFKSGAIGIIDANRIAGPAIPEIAFGSLRIDGTAGSGRMLPDGTIVLVPHEASERPHPYPIPSTGYKGDSVYAFQQHAVRCLETGESSESEGTEYLRTVAAVEACYRSAQDGLRQIL